LTLSSYLLSLAFIGHSNLFASIDPDNGQLLLAEWIIWSQNGFDVWI
jgi:hypothetical protein